MTEYLSSSLSLPKEFLSGLVRELDDETVTALILHGSYARGDELPPYSDVDLVRIVKETPERYQQKRFLWHNSYLLNLSTRPLSIYREWLMVPQEAVFRISTIRDARILLDKEGAFAAFQQETRQWKWEDLQPAANAYASQLMVELTEVILRTLGALRYHKPIMLVERITLHILPTITEAVGVQRGILAVGNHYLRQIQETVGVNSDWMRFYLEAAGVAPEDAMPLSLERRARAALHLYQETVRLLRACFSPEHLETIETLLRMVNEMLDEEMA